MLRATRNHEAEVNDVRIIQFMPDQTAVVADDDGQLDVAPIHALCINSEEFNNAIADQLHLPLPQPESSLKNLAKRAKLRIIAFWLVVKLRFINLKRTNIK